MTAIVTASICCPHRLLPFPIVNQSLALVLELLLKVLLVKGVSLLLLLLLL